MNAGEIPQEWALACCETLERRDIESHMNLISQSAALGGIRALSAWSMLGLK